MARKASAAGKNPAANNPKKNAPVALAPSRAGRQRWAIALAGAGVVLAAVVAYHNSFSGSFLMDDELAVTDNVSIRHWASALSPPADATTGGRPLLNLTFALNHALGGLNVRGYHVFNLAVHALAGLVLFGLVRRTLSRPPLNGRFGAADLPLALAVAVIWTVHPLQTQAVSYISQRAESLMGLCYLLTLYGFIRGVESPVPVRWQIFSVLACLLGAMFKEVIATAPLMVLLYDRTFAAGSFREAWRRRWRYYLGLAGTWLPLACSMGSLHQRSVGFNQGVSSWDYALTSCRSVALYLKLAVWPHPLVFDYGPDVIHHAAEAAPYALVVAVLVAGTAIAFWRRRAAGFAGGWFFLILAPASSVIPVAEQPMAESRVYLSLAAVISLGALGLYSLMGRRSLVLLAVLAAGSAWLTVRRNEDYRSAESIWRDTAAKRPGSARAAGNLGYILSITPGRMPEAIAEYETALRINPDYADAHDNLGCALAGMPGRLPEGIAHLQAALRLKPDFARAHNNLGTAYSNAPGRLPDAIAEYKTALRINPNFADAHNNLGSALWKTPGRLDEAIAEYEAALRIDPDFAEAHNNLGCVLGNMPGRLPEAIVHLQAAVRLKPRYAEAHKNLGMALAAVPGRSDEAIAEYETALRIDPSLESARQKLMQLRATQR